MGGGCVAACVAMAAIRIVLLVDDVDDALHEEASGVEGEGLLEDKLDKLWRPVEDDVSLFGELRPREVVVQHPVHELVKAVHGEAVLDGADVVGLRRDTFMCELVALLVLVVAPSFLFWRDSRGLCWWRDSRGLCWTSLVRTRSGRQRRGLGRRALCSVDHVGMGLVAHAWGKRTWC